MVKLLLIMVLMLPLCTIAQEVDSANPAQPSICVRIVSGGRRDTMLWRHHNIRHHNIVRMIFAVQHG